MNHQFEILVHASGPSRGTDDARYRREAQGLLSFKPVNTYQVLDGKRREAQISQRTQTDHWPSLQRDAARQGQRLGPTQEVQNIRQSFHTRVQEATPTRAQHDPHTLQTPAVGNVTALPALPWASIKATPHLLIERTPALPRPRTAPDAAPPSEGPKTLRRTQSDSWQTPPSVIPDSQPSQQPTQNHAASSPVPKRPFQSSSPSPTRNSCPTGKRVRRQSPSSRHHDSPSDPSSDRPTPHAREVLVISSSSQECGRVSSPSSDLPLEIHPAKPNIINTHFTSHLTPVLSSLSTKMPRSRFFTHDYSLRPLDPLERGHWLICISSWPNTLKTKFWTFLAGFIGGGHAGWGVWCIREMVPKSRGDSSGKENETPVEEEVLKVYCWGEVVREIWLGLYAGSDKIIKREGAKWIDAGGKVVVELRRKEM